MRFAVVTFKRVFDVEIHQECVTLEQLVEGLLRFELKPALPGRVARDRKRLDAALEAWRAGEWRAGYHYSQLLRAAKAARRAGASEEEAVLARCAKIERDSKDKNKKDLRIWAPAHYVADTRRSSENVLSLSCLVMDYDDGTPVPEIGKAWAEWFHVLHTTWSHTAERHKVRLCLPLAAPVFAGDWERVWGWAFDRAGARIDTAPRSPGSNFALPALPSREWPHVGRVNPGALLDCVALGLEQHAAPASLPLFTHDDSHFRAGGDPSKRYVEVPHGPLDTEPWDVDAAFEELF